MAEPDLKDRKISECNSHNHHFMVPQTCIFGEEIQDWQVDSQSPSTGWFLIQPPAAQELGPFASGSTPPVVPRN